MTTITEEHNNQLNAIKNYFRSIALEGVIVNAEFIANTNESKDYLGHIYLTNVKGLGNNKIYSCGVALDEMGDTQKCVDKMKSYIDREGLAFLWK